MRDATKRSMKTLLIRNLVAVAVLGLAPIGSAACTVAELPPPEYAEGFDPQYYDGYVVYYDEIGRPYYYMDGSIAWVPVTSAYYGPLLHYWRLHGPAYQRWYSNYGYRYRGYRYHGH
jgi:hypothetical protein